MPVVDANPWKRRLQTPRDLKDGLILTGIFVLILIQQRSGLQNYVGAFLNLPFDPGEYDVPAPLWQIRREFVEGLVSGAALLLALAITPVMSERSPQCVATFVAYITNLPTTINALMIFATCDHLRDYTGVVTVISGPMRSNVRIGTLVLVGVGYYFLNVRERRAQKTIADSAHAGGSQPIPRREL